MTPLDEMRALARWKVDLHAKTCVVCTCGECSIAKAALAMLPVVEAAGEHHARWMDAGYKPHIAECNLCQAVAAFRAANREGETKAT